MIVLTCPGVFEFEEKKSRFIGYAEAVACEGEAKAVLARVRGLHPRANHHVYAYATRADCVIRASDDGEPHGTAGQPVLQVFDKGGAVDWICVVVRYFGGTLLGAGGLVRAYTAAAKGAFAAAAPRELIPTRVYSVTCEYNQFDQLKYNFGKWGVEIAEVEYTTICTIRAVVTEPQEGDFRAGTGYEIGDVLEEIK
jgi:uncharacterized YigZ family protein